MVNPKVKEICKDIKALKIQGAREVAKWAVKALAIQASESKATTVESMGGELIEVADMLAATRPTEPMMRNSLMFVFSKIKKENLKNTKELRELIKAEEKSYLSSLDKSISAIAEYGAKEMPKGGTILIHCHSHTVVGVAKRAHEIGKGVKAICCETRPLYQGRITARELAEAGVPTKLIVDSAVKSFIAEADAVLVGADSIDSVGNLINKIGTSTIALVAFERDVPVYSAAELYKFDPMTLWGSITKIEERDPSEVADPKSLEGVDIRNPAFDLTQAKYITGYITERGVIPPQGLMGTAMGKGISIENPMNR
ncbi:MAG: S-methyl-5-thioribose-1-phosphate isomerase [Candidatus Micrarchaeota archaeon]